jgi:(p)ppGpp synthase/HD superfamily hydrolase
MTVVSGILHDVIEDCVRDGYTRDMLEQRIGDKFGPGVLDTVLAVTYRRHDDDGVELSGDERKTDYLERLAGASAEARWVCAADKLHNVSTIISDLRRTVDPETVWNRFGGGKAATARWYRQVYERLREVGFDAPIMTELDQASSELQKFAA